MRIRRMLKDDIKDVMLIESLCLKDFLHWKKKYFLNDIRSDDAELFVAIVDDEVVGYTAYYLDDDRTILSRLSVHPFHQRQGIGSQLLDEAEATLIGRRKRLIVFVHEECLEMQNLLKKKGARMVRFTKDVYPDGRGELKFILRNAKYSARKKSEAGS